MKLEAAQAAPPRAAQNGMTASAAPPKQESSAVVKHEAKQGTPQGAPAQMDSGKYMYSTKVGESAFTLSPSLHRTLAWMAFSK